jgi:hypothetical protein
MNKKINKTLDRVSKTSLSEKQSVRTTFKLSENSNNAIDWLIKTNNLKPKEVFDLMCSNENLVDFAIEAAQKNGKSNSTKQTRKTFVISKQVLRLLNRYSKKHKLSRDLIVENLILLFKALLEKHAEEEKQREEKALTIISDFCSKAESVEKQLKDLLDDDSPILDRFGYVIVLLMNLVSAIESKLSDGVSIDPDDMSQS